MKSSLKFSALPVLLFIMLSSPLSASTPEADGSEYFKLSPFTDGMLIGGGVLLNAAGITVGKISEPEDGWIFDDVPDISTVNPFDSLYVLPYSESIDTASDLLTYAAMLAPAVLVAAPVTEWITIGTMYAESVIWAWGLKELGKNLVHRNRPYMYFSDYPVDDIAGGDFQQSFPSGHATLAFAGAGFCTFVFSRYFEDSSWKIPVIAGSYSIAAASAVMRVAGGSHFLTDVITGALIGTLSGFIVPWIHTLRIEPEGDSPSGVKSLYVDLVPSGIYVKLGF